MDKTLQKPRVSRRETEKLALIEQWEKSSLSIKAFCRQHGFSDALFHNWLAKYRRAKEALPSPKGVIPLHLSDLCASREDPPAPYARIAFSKGSRLTLYQPVDVDVLRSLLAS